MGSSHFRFDNEGEEERVGGEAESSLGLIRYPCPCDMSDDMTELLFT